MARDQPEAIGRSFDCERPGQSRETDYGEQGQYVVARVCM